jgi:hypothetical protein
MPTFLSVWKHTVSSSTRLGTLEISYQVSKDGVESKGWEWRASGKGNADGGSWEWIYNTKHDWVEIHLTSGVSKAVVAQMRATEYWKGSKMPPYEPWFRGSSFINFMSYTDPNGTVHTLGWEPVK